MAQHDHTEPADRAPAHASAAEYFIVAALLGVHGPELRDAADTAMATAIEHGYAEDSDRVAATVHALHQPTCPGRAPDPPR